MRRISAFILPLVFATLLFATETTTTVSGTVTDSLGAVIVGAKVEVLQNGVSLQSAKTDAAGSFRFTIEHAGRYQVRAEATSFRRNVSPEVFVSSSHTTNIDLVLWPSGVSQDVVVSATGTPIPEAQTGASVSVIDGQDLAGTRDLQQALRLQPGVQGTQAGQPGAQASLFVRGGPSDANKVLIDGIPANDIGGSINFGNLSSAGYDKVELFRGPNSALYGSDALASVINVTTRRGSTPLPELNYSADGGTFGTFNQDASVGGAWRQFDYFSDFSRFDTQNSTPNSEFHNGAYLGNFGFQVLPNTELRATLRRTVTAFNSANSIDLYGIPDDGVDREKDLAFGVTLENRFNDRWHNLVRYGGLSLRTNDNNFGPTGIPVFGGSEYLGLPVTIQGANGFVVSPQLVAQASPGTDFPGQAYFQSPGPYSLATVTDRGFVYAQTDYRFSSMLTALFGFRYEDERGYTTNVFSNIPSTDSTKRGNYSYMMEAQGGFWNRLYYTVGGGVENNAVFGVAATPRASLAYYLVKPSSSRWFSGTRLKGNFSKGIKEPSIFYQTNSLYGLLQTLPSGPQVIAQDGVQPFRAELSRTYDAGVEQQLLAGKARVSLTYFHNEFGDQAEFIPNTALAQAGVPAAVAQFILLTEGPFNGVATNTLAYRAQGTELEAEYHLKRNVTVRGGWTWTDAVVQHSFASSALAPAINPLFPNIPIGAFSPLIGARPFRIAPNTGYMAVDWNARRWFASLRGSFVSRRDDSDFLSDADFGNTLLLPNRNLDPAYQKLDLYGSYRLTNRLTIYSSIENLLNQHYQEAFGFPALPFTIRSGLKIRVGGDSWKLN